eukprot:95131-Rhodomonas_salina.4
MPWYNIEKLQVLDLQFNATIQEAMLPEKVGTLTAPRMLHPLQSFIKKDLFGPPVILRKKNTANTHSILTRGSARNLRDMFEKGYITKYPEDIQFPNNIDLEGIEQGETSISITNDGVEQGGGMGGEILQLPAEMLLAYPQFVFVQYIYNKYLRERLRGGKKIVVEHADNKYTITLEERDGV